MVVIRLARAGRTNTVRYRVTVADGRKCRDGKFLERVGWYNPTSDDPKTRILLNIEAIDGWIKKGAQPSETVAKLIKDYKKAQKH